MNNCNCKNKNITTVYTRYGPTEPQRIHGETGQNA